MATNTACLIYIISILIWFGIGLYYLAPMEITGWPIVLWLGFSFIFIIIGCILGIII